MPVDHVVKRHWIVAAFNSSEDENEIGTVGVIDGASEPHATLAAAQERARELAANNPNQCYAVYEATWHADVDVTPVELRRVVTTVT